MNEDELRCDPCGEDFPDKATLGLHQMSEEHLRVIYEDVLHANDLEDKDDERSNSDACSSNKHNSCSACNMQFPDEESLDDHLSSRTHIIRVFSGRWKVNKEDAAASGWSKPDDAPVPEVPEVPAPKADEQPPDHIFSYTCLLCHKRFPQLQQYMSHVSSLSHKGKADLHNERMQLLNKLSNKNEVVVPCKLCQVKLKYPLYLKHLESEQHHLMKQKMQYGIFNNGLQVPCDKCNKSVVGDLGHSSHTKCEKTFKNKSLQM